MNIFSRIFKFIKNIFYKNKSQFLKSPEITTNFSEELQNKKPIFMEDYRKKMAEVKTLVHDGSGLGIQHEIKY